MADPKSLSEDKLTVTEVDYADMRRIRTELRDAWITVSEKLAFQVIYKHLMQSFVKEEEEESLLYSLCGVVEAHLPGASLFGGDTCPQDGVTRTELLSAPAAKLEPSVQAAKVEPSWQAAKVEPSLQAAKVEPSLQAAKVGPSLPAANVGPRRHMVLWKGSPVKLEEGARTRRVKTFTTPDQTRKAIKDAFARVKFDPKWQRGTSPTQPGPRHRLQTW